MIQSISSHTFQTVKYFSILKFMILQQNISSVWIFGDQNSWHEHGIETNGIIQQLVGTVPKYVFDLNNINKKLCVDVDNEYTIHLNIFLVSQNFGAKEMKSICPTDYTMVLVQNITTTIVLPKQYFRNTQKRLVFGNINSSTIASMTTIDDCIVESMENLFARRSFNLNFSDFRIFFQLRPPNSMFTLMNKKFIFFGPDAYVAQEIAKMLNGTAVFQTNIGFKYPRYEFWFNDTKYPHNNRILRIRKNIYAPNFISNFYQNCSNYADLHISAQRVKGNSTQINNFLYPHDTECLRVVVPRIKTEQRFTVKLAHNSIIQSIGLLMLLMFISKIILNRSNHMQDWTLTLFSILAVLFGQKRQKLSNKTWETIWNGQLNLIVIFSTAALSAISYQTLISVKYVNQIDTLNDLINSNLMVFVETSRSTDFESWGSNLDPRLFEKFIYQNEMINYMQNQTNNVAYVWEDRMASLHVTISEYFAPVGEPSAMRVATEPLYCGLSSARVGGHSTFKYAINKLVIRLFESGISTQQLDWAIQYVKATKIRTDADSEKRIHPLTLSKNFGVFVLYVGGMTLACSVFILEILWKWLTLQTYKISRRHFKREIGFTEK